MNAFENVRFTFASNNNNVSVTQLNSMVEFNRYGQFFSRTTAANDLILVRAPVSFAKFLKSKSNVSQLAEFGAGPGLTVKRDSKFSGLFWREEKKRLYVMYEGRTIPWKNWVEWCRKQQLVAN